MKTILFLNILIAIAVISNLHPQTPLLMKGYPVVLDSNVGTYSGGAPIVADFDNDGQNEILVCVNYGGPEGTVFLLNGDGTVKPNFPKKVGCTTSYIFAAAGDVNDDGLIDIVVKADSVCVFDYQGNNLNGFPAFFPNSLTDYGDRLAIYDLDNDGKLEIIVGRSTVVYVYNFNGQIRNGWPRTFSIGSNVGPSFPSIGDLNNDNIPEIIFPASSYDINKIFIFEPDGQLYSGSSINCDSSYNFSFNPAIIFKNKQKDSTFFVINSNYSPDGTPNTIKTRVTIYHNTNIINRFNLTPRFRTDQLSMGDLNNDSIPDIVFGSSFYELYAYNLNGNLFQGFPVVADNYEYRSSSIGKISSDMNIMAMGGPQDPNYLNYIRAFTGSGIQLPWSPLRPRGIPVSAVTFGDINNDKQVDFLITSIGVFPGQNSGLYAWTVPGIGYVKQNFPWPMYAHDRYRTNQYGFTPPDEPVGIRPVSNIVPDKFILYQNYPNPFNPSTKIKFDLKTSAFVKLIVFDMLGKEVAKLVDEKLQAGTYQVVFDGSNYSSGIYFYELEMMNYKETKKMILLK